MIAIKVKANLKVNNNKMKLENVVNTTTFIYSRIKHFNMEYNDDHTEMEFSIEYETPDDEFMRLEEIINTNNILGSELTYLNIDSEHISVDNGYTISVDKVTIPEDADMELKDQTDYYVFGRNLHGEMRYWAGHTDKKPFGNKWVADFKDAKRFKTFQNAVDSYCDANNVSLRFINSWDTINDVPDIKGPYHVIHIVNDMIYYIDYYDEL